MYYKDYSVNKYDKGGKMTEGGENQDERALNQLNKLKEEGKLKKYIDVRGNGKKSFVTIVPNKKEKGMYKRYESLSQSSIGTLQNEYLDETDVLNWLKKTMPKREMTNKIIGESKTENIEEVEINKVSNIDKEIKSLEIALKYSSANTRLRIEKEISSLKIAQKYEKPSKIDKAESKLEGNKAAKIVYDNLPRILSLSIEEIVDPFPKETYNDRLVDLALQIDKTMLTEAHAEWKNNQIRERNVKNILAKRMKNDYYSTLELLELVKTIPKYLHEYKGSIEEIYDNVKAGKMNSDDAAIYLNEEGIEVTYEIYDRLRDMEKKYQKNLRGLEVHDIITVKGKNGNKDFPANFRGFTNDGKLVVVYEGGKQMTINSDEYY
jgi:hypothetical protein